jgi:TetR/AcrR family transcriptional regulator
MSTTTRDASATRTAILDAAEEIFLEHGYNAAAMSRIADQAGVSKGLLHHHFDSKAGLWREVKLRRFKEYSDRQMEMIRESEPDSGLLKRSMEEYFRFLQRNPEMVRILAWIFLEQDEDECVELDQELTVAGIERIREGQKLGLLRSDLNPGFILFTFVGICQHWFQDKPWVLDSMGLSPDSKAVDEAYLQDVTKIFFEGVLPR